MKSSCAQMVFALLVVLSCGQLVVGQDQVTPAATSYAYTAVNAPAASGTFAYAINDTGEIVGYITGGQCTVTSDQTSCGFIDVKGKFTTVACELVGATDFFDVSNAGEIVGAASVIGGVVGIIWEANEACAALGAFGSSTTEAWGVVGQDVVGYYVDSAGNFQGFSYSGTAQTYKNISCPGWADTRAFGMNAAGLIVGDVAKSTGGPFSAMIYDDGKCTIFDYPKAASTSARGINKSDQVSGWYTDSAGKTHGFVKTGSTFTELNYPESIGTLAYHLNDQGQVAGWYEDTKKVDHGFIATPSTATASEESNSERGENQ
jgi:hypothetical protein